MLCCSADREFPLGLIILNYMSTSWYKQWPHVAGSEPDECTKHEPCYRNMTHTWPDYEADIGQSMKQTQWKLSVSRLPESFCLDVWLSFLTTPLHLAAESCQEDMR